MARLIRNKLGLTQFVTQSNILGFNLGLKSCNSRRLLETLAFEEVRSSNSIDKPSDCTAFILHGLLGSARNWRSFARNLSSYLSTNSSSEWRLVLVDLRNHGNSAVVQGLHPPHDLDNAAADLANLVKSQGWDWPDVVMGHSLGGKVALQFAQGGSSGDYGDSITLPKQLWVLDSVPGVVNPEDSSGEVEKVLETLQSLPSQIPSRKWLVEHMIKLGFSKSLSEWLGTNLKKSNDHETWAFNLDGAFQMFNSYREKDYWPLLGNPPRGMEISIVQAENSDRWDPYVIQRLESLTRKERDGSEGKFSLHVLPKAGHWVHVDNPKGLLDIVAPRIASLK
ncbi:protein ABHD11-like [Chenopodium quinoa]|uniref:protein ABHD11-like n=1 Tax=Chenopodium quinoa TaxID=63459 RepID=UPI000B77A9CD|nr:protein ABHD11-like [Chenopodium quinoa]